MKNSAVIMILPLVLAACSGGASKHDATWDALKVRCLAQDFEACSDIGHLGKQPPVDY